LIDEASLREVGLSFCGASGPCGVSSTTLCVWLGVTHVPPPLPKSPAMSPAVEQMSGQRSVLWLSHRTSVARNGYPT
jgi:hypothetical protein